MHRRFLIACFFLGSLASSVYSLEVEDDRSRIVTILEAFEMVGSPVSLPRGFSIDLPWNNSNGVISPGEIVLIGHKGVDMFAYSKMATLEPGYLKMTTENY